MSLDSFGVFPNPIPGSKIILDLSKPELINKSIFFEISIRTSGMRF